VKNVEHRFVEFVPELPKTVSGKTQRYRLREMARARTQPVRD